MDTTDPVVMRLPSELVSELEQAELGMRLPVTRDPSWLDPSVWIAGAQGVAVRRRA